MRAINIPSQVKIEFGIFENINNYLDNTALKLDKVLIVSGVGSTVNFAQEIKSKIEFKYAVEHIMVETNSMDSVLNITERIVFEEFTVIIGVGGGKVLDLCKYIAYISRIDFVAVPTSLAHDGIASPIAVLKVGNQVKSLGCNIPKLVLVDLEVIMASPLITRQAGVGDILSNYTATFDWKLAYKNGQSKIDDFALMLSDMAYTSVVNHPIRSVENIDFVKTLVQAVILSGIAMEISRDSRPCSGSEHLFSHALDSIEKDYTLPHGIQVAIGSVMAAYIQGQDFKKQMQFLKDFNIPYKPSMCGLSDEIVVQAWINAKGTRKGRYTVLDIVDSQNKEFFYNVVKNINDINLE